MPGVASSSRPTSNGPSCDGGPAGEMSLTTSKLTPINRSTDARPMFNCVAIW